MKWKEVSRILKTNDFGDDLFEKNLFFDEDYTPVKSRHVSMARQYANQKMTWYFDDFQKAYQKADCNSFHDMWKSHAKEFLIGQHGYKNPLVGLCYGTWDGTKHMWAFIIKEPDILLHLNWGYIEQFPSYKGKGSFLL